MIARQSAVEMPRGSRLRLALSLLLNAAVPLVVYLLVRSHVDSDVTALAIAVAVPVAVTLGGFAMRRRLDPIGAVAVVAFGLVLIVLALTGGNPLVLKLQEAVVTGPLGVVLLGSVVIGRPAHPLVSRVLARRDPASAARLDDQQRRRGANVVTTVLGTTLALHALVLLALALSLPTGTYLAVSRPIGLAIVAAGTAVLLWYRRRLDQVGKSHP
ncbi:MAG TPA: VC0807 family protein [Actinophytocola sp.]|jgi:FtsH-binding integral membrane protein|nr:VC0807 family protein [Actinophytocola sp.]